MARPKTKFGPPKMQKAVKGKPGRPKKASGLAAVLSKMGKDKGPPVPGGSPFGGGAAPPFGGGPPMMKKGGKVKRN